jgi:hypothetical protein
MENEGGFISSSKLSFIVHHLLTFSWRFPWSGDDDECLAGRNPQSQEMAANTIVLFQIELFLLGPYCELN